MGSIGLGTETAGAAEATGFSVGDGVGTWFSATEGLDTSGDQNQRKLCPIQLFYSVQFENLMVYGIF